MAEYQSCPAAAEGDRACYFPLSGGSEQIPGVQILWERLPKPLYPGGPMQRILVLVADRMCEWAAEAGPCTMCSFWGGWWPGENRDGNVVQGHEEHLLRLLEKRLGEWDPGPEAASWRYEGDFGPWVELDLFIGGSFLNQKEVSRDLAARLVAASIGGLRAHGYVVTDVLVESLPGYVAHGGGKPSEALRDLADVVQSEKVGFDPTTLPGRVVGWALAGGAELDQADRTRVEDLLQRALRSREEADPITPGLARLMGIAFPQLAVGKDVASGEEQGGRTQGDSLSSPGKDLAEKFEEWRRRLTEKGCSHLRWCTVWREVVEELVSLSGHAALAATADGGDVRAPLEMCRPRLWVALGLECHDDCVRKKNLNKGWVTLEGVERSIGALRGLGAGVVVYLLLAPPGLEERTTALEDLERAVGFVASAAGEHPWHVRFGPVMVRDGSAVALTYRSGKYRPPSRELLFETWFRYRRHPRVSLVYSEEGTDWWWKPEMEFPDLGAPRRLRYLEDVDEVVGAVEALRREFPVRFYQLLVRADSLLEPSRPTAAEPHGRRLEEVRRTLRRLERFGLVERLGNLLRPRIAVIPRSVRLPRSDDETVTLTFRQPPWGGGGERQVFCHFAEEDRFSDLTRNLAEQLRSSGDSGTFSALEVCTGTGNQIVLAALLGAEPARAVDVNPSARPFFLLSAFATCILLAERKGQDPGGDPIPPEARRVLRIQYTLNPFPEPDRIFAWWHPDAAPYDLILANPPFEPIPSVILRELGEYPRHSLSGQLGLAHVAAIVDGAAAREDGPLAEGGWVGLITFSLGDGNAPRPLIEMLRAKGFRVIHRGGDRTPGGAGSAPGAPAVEVVELGRPFDLDQFYASIAPEGEAARRQLTEHLREFRGLGLTHFHLLGVMFSRDQGALGSVAETLAGGRRELRNWLFPEGYTALPVALGGRYPDPYREYVYSLAHATEERLRGDVVPVGSRGAQLIEAALRRILDHVASVWGIEFAAYRVESYSPHDPLARATVGEPPPEPLISAEPLDVALFEYAVDDTAGFAVRSSALESLAPTWEPGRGGPGPDHPACPILVLPDPLWSDRDLGGLGGAVLQGYRVTVLFPAGTLSHTGRARHPRSGAERSELLGHLGLALLEVLGTVPMRLVEEQRLLDASVARIAMDVFAHNFGAHALNALEAWLLEAGIPNTACGTDLPLDRVLRGEQAAPCSPAAAVMAPFAGYLADRAALWAEMARGNALGGEVISWRELIMGFARNVPFLASVAASEGICSVAVAVHLGKGHQWTLRVNPNRYPNPLRAEGCTPGENTQGCQATPAWLAEECTEEAKEAFEGARVFLPGGVAGRQAVYTILENVLRNVKWCTPPQTGKPDTVSLHVQIEEGATGGVGAPPGETSPGESWPFWRVSAWRDRKPRKGTKPDRLERLNGELRRPIYDELTHAPKLSGSSQAKIAACYLLTSEFALVEEARLTLRGQGGRIETLHPWVDFQAKEGHLATRFRLWKGDPGDVEPPADTVLRNSLLLEPIDEGFAEERGPSTIVVIGNVHAKPVWRARDEEEHARLERRGLVRVAELGQGSDSKEPAWEAWLHEWLGDPPEKTVQLQSWDDQVEDMPTLCHGWTWGSKNRDSAAYVEVRHGAAEPGFPLYRSHGSARQFRFVVGPATGKIEKVAPDDPVLQRRFSETLFTTVTMVDNRLHREVLRYAGSPVARRKVETLHEAFARLGLAVFAEEGGEVGATWPAKPRAFLEELHVRGGQRLDGYPIIGDPERALHLAVVHLSLIERLAGGTGVARWVREAADCLGWGGGRLFRKLVIITGRGRTRWWQEVREQLEDEAQRHVLFRPAQNLVRAMRPGMQMGDDLEIKRRLLQALMGG